MTTITQKEAYQMAAKLAAEGMEYSKISLELARKGWISRKTGKALGTTGIATIVRRMKDPNYKPLNFTITKYAKAHGRYKTRQYTPKALDKLPPVGSPTHVYPYMNMPQRHALETLQAHSSALRGVAAAIDTLVAAIK